MATLVQTVSNEHNPRNLATQGGGPTAYSNTDWDVYIRSRPVYPQSLVDIINTYHRTHGDPTSNRIVDLGSGIGVGITRFAKDFNILHLSDPSADNQRKSSKFVEDYMNKYNVKAKVEFSQSLGEESYKHVGSGTADMVIAATAAHFMDADEMVASVAKMLHPGGTMAIFSYSFPRFPTESKRFSDSFTETFEDVFGHVRHSSDLKNNKTINRCITQITSGNGGLSYLPMPDEYFKDKQRVVINGSDGQMQLSERYKRMLFLPGQTPVEPRVLPNERYIRLNTGRDISAEGWTEPVDKQFLLNFLHTLRPLGDQVPDPGFLKLLENFSQVYDEEIGPGGFAKPCWPVHIALATRK